MRSPTLLGGGRVGLPALDPPAVVSDPPPAVVSDPPLDPPQRCQCQQTHHCQHAKAALSSLLLRESCVDTHDAQEGAVHHRPTNVAPPMAKPLPADVARSPEAARRVRVHRRPQPGRRHPSRPATGQAALPRGEAGVGKTEVAKVLAEFLKAPSSDCSAYEGLDAGHALYEWDYARQMLAIGLLEARGEGHAADVKDIMSRDYLVARPLLKAVELAALEAEARAAHRRDRPGRRGVRGIPARAAFRLPGHHPGGGRSPPRSHRLSSSPPTALPGYTMRSNGGALLDRLPELPVREVAIVGRKVPGISGCPRLRTGAGSWNSCAKWTSSSRPAWRRLRLGAGAHRARRHPAHARGDRADRRCRFDVQRGHRAGAGASGLEALLVG